ncbi:MAG: endonuclease domain-containing protein [Cyanobacteria bacterium P01_G01_bin.38]
MSHQKPRIRGTTPEIEAAARRLRKNPTLAEQTLWTALKNRQLEGLKFRAQHPIGRFIIDFYCPICRLLIEVDGAAHQTQADYDRVRTEQLEAYGYKVLRFTNDEVMNNLPFVLSTIRQTALGRMT